MKDESLQECSRSCLKCNKVCEEDECRYWIDYGDDYNCSLISVYLHGPMTLNEVSKRIGLSLVRISQIEKKAVQKLLKNIKL